MSFDWTEIETVLLDLDGTLLDLHFDNYFWQEYLPALGRGAGTGRGRILAGPAPPVAVQTGTDPVHRR